MTGEQWTEAAIEVIHETAPITSDGLVPSNLGRHIEIVEKFMSLSKRDQLRSLSSLVEAATGFDKAAEAVLAISLVKRLLDRMAEEEPEDFCIKGSGKILA